MRRVLNIPIYKLKYHSQMPKKISTDDFIEKAKDIHGDLYDYSLVKYKNWKSKIKVICNKHGVFDVSPNNHTSKKSGCPKCYGNKKLSLNEFIERSSRTHKDFVLCISEYKNHTQYNSAIR